MKVFFTRHTTGEHSEPRSESRRKHREQNVWQRRFWEHTIRDEQDFAAHFDYIHYNAVKHDHATCPHLWKHSSFARWVARGVYDEHWGCSCDGRIPIAPDFRTIEHSTGE
jgi:putative transposase